MSLMKPRVSAFSVGLPRAAVRELLSGFQEERKLSWFTLGRKVSVSVWVPLNVKLEKRIWGLYLPMIQEAGMKEWRGRQRWKETHAGGWYQGCCRK